MALRFSYFLLFVVLACSFSSCSDDEDATDIQGTDSATIHKLLLDGSWYISYYWDTDHEETHEYVNYTFRFYDNGNLEASTGSSVVIGTWMLDNDDDSSSDLVIAFQSISKFENDLSEDWEILEINSAQIRLQHESGGDGDLDFLTFKKI